MLQVQEPLLHQEPCARGLVSRANRLLTIEAYQAPPSTVRRFRWLGNAAK
jgi:hypothetical protein